MRGERTYTGTGQTGWQRVLWLLALAAPAWGQISISSIQSSVVGGNPANVQGITSGVQLPGGGFTMYINGSFPNVAVGASVDWFNTSSGTSFSTQAAVTPSQLQVFIPEDLYLPTVASTQTVQITVTQGPFQATGQFFVNAPVSSAPSPLPLATVGVTYSTPIVVGGTPPYVVGPVTGLVPPGLQAGTGPQNQLLSGIPTTQGIFNFIPTGADQWGAGAQKGLQVQVIAPATITFITPNAAPAGSGLLQITVNGANFVDPQSPAGGSSVQWKFNNVTSTLFTAYISATQLVATVPTALMSTPGVASVAVLQPDNTSSPGSPFTLLAPVITALSPTSASAGSGGFTLNVTGANFADRSAAPDAVGVKLPQIQFGPSLIQASIVNATTLRLAIPANLITTVGPIAVTEINPGGASSNGLTFTVTPPPTIILAPASLTFSAIAGSSNPPSQSLNVTASDGSGINFTAAAASVGWLGATLPSGVTPATSVVSANITGLSAGTYPGTVTFTGPNNSTVLPVTLTVIAPLTINPISPPVGGIGTPYNMTVTAAGGIGTYTWSATGLPPGFGINPQTGVISGTPQNPGSFPVSVKVVDAASNTVSAPFTITINPSTLVITTGGLPAGTSGTPYFTKLGASGGTGGYTWSAAGLPAGLVLNAQTGDIEGTPQGPGTFPVSVTVTDSQHTSVSAVFTITIGLPPPTISTPSALPNGTVGVSYQASIGVSGGGGPFTFAVTGGSLPDGLSLLQNGLIFGTPTKPGTFAFSITAGDPAGNSAGKGFTILIAPAPLTVPGGVPTTGTAGTPVNINLTPTGGVGPFQYTVSCALPPGLTFSNGVISGTPTTAGVYPCRVVVSDSTGTSITKDITITVVAPTLTFKGATLPDGQVGVSYSASVSAAGGTPPLTYSGSGLPDGLSLSSAGAISGTPGTAGSFTLSVTATDSASAKATASFTITIAPAKLTVTTAALPDGVVGANYSASLVAAGGVRPYTWTVAGLPGGVTASAAGAIIGTPNAAGKFTVSATVKDNAGATAAGSYTITIAAAPLVITTAAAASGTVGSAYTATFAATGGVSPLAWSATGLPGGLSMSAAGAISGTPTAPGTSNVTVTVRDTAGATTTKPFTIVIALPATPPLNFAGITNASNPLQQPRLTVALGTAYPVDVVVTLTLTFAPDAGADDPTIVFSGGGRTVRITVPAGSLNGATDAGVQTGTVAGLITITAQLQATGLDVTPSPAPRQTIRISPGAPVMTTVTATRNGTGFTVTINGYVTDREITQAIFTFNPTAGSTLQTTSLTVTPDTLFSGYFGGTGAAPFGSQFTFTQPFTVNGNAQSIASVTVTLVNKIGNSTAVTVNLN